MDVVNDVRKGLDEDEPFEWAFRHGRAGKEENFQGHYLDEMAELNEFLDEMRETQAIFDPNDKFDWWNSNQDYPRIMSYFGVWQVPSRFPRQSQRKWVNPQSRWSHKYSDAAVKCKCDAILYTVENRTNNHDFHQRCEDNCMPQWKHQSWSKLWQKRQQVYIQSALMGLSRRRVAKNRFGLVADMMTQISNRLGIDFDELYTIGRRKLRQTFIAFKREFDVTNKKISVAFDVSSTTVRDYIKGRQTWFENPIDPEVNGYE